MSRRLFSLEEVANNPGIRFVWGNYQGKEIIDDKTGQKMTLKFVVMRLQTSDDGKTYPAYIEFPLHSFRGIKKENQKVTSLTIYDSSDEKIMDMIETTQHSQKHGWIKKADAKLEIDIDEKTATSKDDSPLKIYDSAGGEELFQVEEDEAVIIYSQKKVGSSVWLQVKTRGKTGLIQKVHNKMAQVIFDKKDDLGLSSKETVHDVEKMFKHNVYWPPVNKDTGEQRNPSSFINFVYYSRDNQFADVSMPNPDNPSEPIKFMPEDLKDVNFDAIPVMNYGRVLVSAAKINPQNKVMGAVITDVKKYERKSLQHDTLTNLGISTDQLRRNMEVVKQARIRAAESSPEREESSAPNEGGEDIDDILGGGAVSETIELAGGKGDDEFPEVEGLDDI